MALPLGKTQAQEAALWLRQHFEGQINEMIAGTPWSIELVCAIACQETAQRWIRWIDNYDAETILARCVFDASGEPEFPTAVRSAFPKNRDVFRAHYGNEFLQMLIDEGNKQRAMPQPGYPNGYRAATYLYKGYGIFQYDLQHITTDRQFFEQKQWYHMTYCLQRLVDELNRKARLSNNLHGIVKAYNGAGTRAENYANNVMQFVEWV